MKDQADGRRTTVVDRVVVPAYNQASVVERWVRPEQFVQQCLESSRPFLAGALFAVRPHEVMRAAQRCDAFLELDGVSLNVRELPRRKTDQSIHNRKDVLDAVA